MTKTKQPEQLYQIIGIASERRSFAPNRSTVTWFKVRHQLTDNPMTLDRAVYELQKIKRNAKMYDSLKITPVDVLR